MSLMDLASQQAQQPEQDDSGGQGQQPAQPPPVDLSAFQRMGQRQLALNQPQQPPAPPPFQPQPTQPSPKPQAVAPLGPLAQNDQPAVLGDGGAQAPQEPHRPYIMTQAHTMPPSAWGKPDYVWKGAQNYPGMAPGPYMPQRSDFPTLIPMIAMGLGRWGSRNAGMPALAMASFFNAYVDAKQKGQKEREQEAFQQWKMATVMTAQRQADENREYGDAFAAYGPHTDPETGKFYAGNQDALHNAILTIAGTHQDSNIPAVLQTGGWPAVEQLIKHREGLGQDANKLLSQMIKQNQIELQLEKLRKMREAERSSGAALEPFLRPRDPGAVKSSVLTSPPPPKTTDDPDLYFEPEFGGGSQPPKGTEKPQASAADDVSDTGGIAGAPGEGDEGATPKQADAEQPAAEDTSQAEPEQPEEQPEQAAAAEPQPGQVQMAGGEAEPGTASDAPPPEAAALTPPRGQPATAAAAPAAPRGDRGAAPAAAPAQTVPTPAGPLSLKPGPMGDVAEAQDSGVEYNPPESNVLKSLGRTVVQTPDGPRQYNLDAVDTLARQLVNGSIKQDEINALKKEAPELVAAARARGLELVKQMNDIANDPRLTGAAVYRALDKVNPEFTATVKAAVEGRIALPTSAWANWQYRLRIVNLGSKVDPGFNENTFHDRKAAYEAYGKGTQSMQIGALTTAFRHANEFERKLDNLPDAWKRALMSKAPITSGLFVSDEERARFGELRRDAKILSDEIAAALAMGRPSLGGQKTEEALIDVAHGDYQMMKGDLRGARSMMVAKLDEWQNRFAAATGNQPRAMNSYFEHAKALGDPDAQSLKDLQTLHDQPTAPVGTSPVGTPSPQPAAAPAAPQVGEVRRGWKFNGGDPSSPSSWTKVNP